MSTVLRRLVLCVLSLTCAPQSARAYSYASPLAPGCHEAITLTALRKARGRLEAAAPLPASKSDRAWIEDLPLVLPVDAEDLGAATLIAGVRDNDLKGRHGLDTSELALVHGDPDAQEEHCLRKPSHDEPTGTQEALQACRSYIARRAASALEGLDTRGYPDSGTRIGVDVHLAFAGARTVRMPRSYVELGRALHALQDSFSHAVRSGDGLRVRTLLNWTDYVQGHHQEHRDGPVHRAALDRCESLDAVRRLRLQRAIEASTALLLVALEPESDREQRLADVESVLDEYMSHEPGCGAENDFCDAEELAYPVEDMGCRVSHRGETSPAGVLAFLAVPLLLGLRRCGWLRSPSLARALMLGLLAAAILPRAAQAQEPAQASYDFALSPSASGAVDQGAIAAGLGGHYRVSKHVLLGLGAEWSPWASIELRRMRPGTFNVYGSVIYRPYVVPELALRTTGHIGGSVLLFDLYGAPAGSAGPYVGLSLLGLELPLTSRLRLVLDPAHVVMAAPQLRGIPLTHREYRATVTLEVWM